MQEVIVHFHEDFRSTCPHVSACLPCFFEQGHPENRATNDAVEHAGKMTD